MLLCFKLCSFRSQCSVEMERLILIKLEHEDVVFVCYRCSAFHILFLKEDLIEMLRDCCYRYATVSDDSCIQSFKKHYINYEDLCYGCV